MKILMIAQRLPYPPDKGEKIRSFHELTYLAERHDVWCACLIDDGNDWQHVEPLRKRCRDLVALPLRKSLALLRATASVASGGTITEGYFASRRLRATISAWSSEIHFDAVLAFSSSIAHYGLAVRARRRVVDLCDVDSAKWASYAQRAALPLRLLLGTEARRLARLEWNLARAYDDAAVISPREAELFDEAGRRAGLSETERHGTTPVVIRNGVDLEAFHRPARPASDPVVGFVGTMDYRPNIEAVTWFAENVWPGVRNEIPDARFTIVGRSPQRRVLALAKLPGIEVTGTVPSVLEYLHGLQACVVPMQMVHGLQNKALEAMACGIPVVATKAVAASLGARDQEHLLTADQAASFGKCVVDLLKDAELRGSLGHAGREFVAKSFRWETEMARLEELLQ